jgi:hypothetical protein
MQGQDFVDVHLPDDFFILVLSLSELNDGSAMALTEDFGNTKAGDCFVNNIVGAFQAGEGFGKETGLLGYQTLGGIWQKWLAIEACVSQPQRTSHIETNKSIAYGFGRNFEELFDGAKECGGDPREMVAEAERRRSETGALID